MSGGERDRFECLWQEHYPDVLAFVLRRVADPEAAHDIVAETFLVAWRRAADLPLETRPWLFGVARGVLANARRSDKRRQALVERLKQEPAPVALADSPRPGSLEELVQLAFTRLSAADREALRLVTWDELTPREAAHVTGVSPARFSVRLHRAKQRLRKQTDALRADQPLRASSAPRSILATKDSS